jgi:hypothetical protein
MTIHYIVASGYTLSVHECHDFVQLMPGASINLMGGRVTKNIWGPGNTTISGNVTMEASMGVAPSAQQLKDCQVIHINKNTSI